MDFSHQEKLLRARRAELVAAMDDIDHALEAALPSSWEDCASERQGDAVLEVIGPVDHKALKRIDGALARIADGTYGMCLACGGEISPKRLDAVPEAALCRNCA